MWGRTAGVWLCVGHVLETRVSTTTFAALISLGTVSDLSAAALQHGAAKRVVLVVVELTTYSSGRALPLVYSTQQPSGLQREQSRATVPSMSRSAEEGSTFKALPNLPIPPPVPSRRRLQRQMPTAARKAFPVATRPPSLRCAHKRKDWPCRAQFHPGVLGVRGRRDFSRFDPPPENVQKPGSKLGTFGARALYTDLYTIRTWASVMGKRPGLVVLVGHEGRWPSLAC